MQDRSRLRLKLAVLLCSVSALMGFSGAAASASTLAVSASYQASCFGYVGTFKDNSGILLADWDRNGTWDECFGIAPTRTIWHAWPGSGGWKVMPNNGRADDTVNAFRNAAGQRTVRVWVSGSPTYWCSSLSTSWQPWVRC